MEVIKILIQNCLETPLDFEVSATKNLKFGDFSCNVLMKHKTTGHSLVENLKAIPLFEKVEISGGHLNFWIQTKPIEISGLSKNIGMDQRMHQVLNRLIAEAYGDEGVLEKEWWPLVKWYNLMVYHKNIFGSLEACFYNKMIDIFKNIDYGYIYREQNTKSLCGIKHLLTLCEAI